MGQRYSALVVLLIALAGCRETPPATAELVVFHAGSLAIPFRDIAAAFEAEHPGVTIVREASGSRAAARKITDLGRPCDVMASADFTVIDELLIPQAADWNLVFVTNEMVLGYGPELAPGQRPTAANWLDLIRRPGARVGHSDPNSDPCGYRAIMVLQLAGMAAGEEELVEQVRSNTEGHIRPKASDLIALLEVGELDYAFLYRSVAVQHGVPFLSLPDDINLKEPARAAHYAQARVEVSGTAPGTTLTKVGTPLAYSVTIPKAAANKELALEFVEFLVREEKGLAIMARHGQPSLVPAPTTTYDQLPERLRPYARAQE